MSTFLGLRLSVVLRASFGTVSGRGFSFVPSRSPVAANRFRGCPMPPWVLSSVPGYLEAFREHGGSFYVAGGAVAVWWHDR